MTSAEEHNLVIVRRILAGYGKTPLDVWLHDYATDFVYEEPGFSGRVQDRATLGAALARQFAAHPELTFVIRTMLAAGERVVVEGEVHYQEHGRSRAVQQALVYTLGGGKVRGLRVYTQPHPETATRR